MGELQMGEFSSGSVAPDLAGDGDAAEDGNAARERALTWRLLRHQNVGESEEPVMLAQELMDTGRMMDARLVCVTALQQDPTDVDLLMTGADVAEGLGELLDARTLLVRAARLLPDWPEPMWRLARLLLRTGDLDRAWYAVAKCKEMEPDCPRVEQLHQQIEAAHRLTLRMRRYQEDPSVDDGAMLANALVAEGRSEEALSVLTLALSEDPEDTDALFVKGNLLRAQGNQTEAREAMRKVTQLASGWVEAWEVMADVLEELGDEEHAERLRAHAATIEVDPLMLVDMAVLAGVDEAAFHDLTMSEELDRAVARGVAAMSELRKAKLRETEQQEAKLQEMALDLETQSQEDSIPEAAEVPETPEAETQSVTQENATREAATEEKATANADSSFAEGPKSPGGAESASENDEVLSAQPATEAVNERPSSKATESAPGVRVMAPVMVTAATEAMADGTAAEASSDDFREDVEAQAYPSIEIDFPFDPESEAFASIDIDLSEIARAPEKAVTATLAIPPMHALGHCHHVDSVGTEPFAARPQQLRVTDAKVVLAPEAVATPKAEEAEASDTVSDLTFAAPSTKSFDDTAFPLELSRKKTLDTTRSIRSEILAALGVADDDLESAVEKTRQEAASNPIPSRAAPIEAAMADAELDSFIDAVNTTDDVSEREPTRPRLRLGKKKRTPYVPPSPSELFPRFTTDVEPERDSIEA